MKEITSIIKENKAEAIEIIKAHGGKIDFVSRDEDGELEFNNESVPWVVYDCNGNLGDFAVLSVSVNDKDEIEFTAFDNEYYENVDDCTTDECVNYTENEIYLFLGELNNNEK